MRNKSAVRNPQQLEKRSGKMFRTRLARDSLIRRDDTAPIPRRVPRPMAQSVRQDKNHPESSRGHNIL
ncbi:hypothetical protein G9C98_007160 [Cotesia typhae]|uniref:Uncharacterized protein n=1 Tax=Cotesia typhae TaxID=2053667 RepID=A0A8J5RI89_9HYME|nr:hypothetical protein G9C98_007160 [Cotesia typhae]